MSLKADLAEAIAREARLRILQVLSEQTDGSLSDLLLKRTLDYYGYRRDRDWIRTQMHKLEALGAITISAVEDVLFATLAPAGRDHLEQRSVIEGVLRPAEAR